MPRSLQVNVQIDPLPRVQGGQAAAYFGVRLSAWINPDNAEPTQSSDRHVLVPWEWTGNDPTRPASWNPADASSWQAWWIDPSNAAGAVPVAVAPLVNADANNPLPPTWLSALDGALTDIASVPTRLEARSGPVSDRTLFGFTETLTTFPAPWPEAHKAWTCLTVATAAPSSKHELVVAPVFGINNAVTGAAGLAGTYTIQSPPTVATSGSEHVWTISYTTAQQIPAASAVVDRLRVPPDDGSRIILENAFLVAGAKSDWTGAGGRDWMIHLPGQIAEILDPARGFSQALEQVLGNHPSGVLPKSGAQSRALRFLLAAAHWRVFALAATGTRAFSPLQVALARARSGRDGQNMLAGLTARDAAQPREGTGFFSSEKLQVWSDSRVLALLGVPKDPNDVVPDWGPAVEAGDGPRSFLVDHWANSPAASSQWQAGAATVRNAGPTTLMRSAAVQWQGNQLTSDPAGLRGLFDLTALKPDAAVDVSFTFKMSKPGAAFALTANLYFDNVSPGAGSTAVATVTTPQMTFPDGAHTLTLGVALPPQQAVPPGALPAGPLPPRRFQFTVATDGGTKFTADIQDPALGGLQDLSAQAGVLAARRAYVTLLLDTAATSMAVAGTLAPDVVRQIIANTPDTALRANLGLAWASPFIPAILSGIGPDGAPALPVAPGAPAPSPTQKIAAALAKWSDFLLADECQKVKDLADAVANRPSPPVPPVSPADLGVAKPLFDLARDQAKTNARAQAAKLFASHPTTPSTDHDEHLANPGLAYRIAVKAEPIIFPIDQPQPFDGAEDIWSMFAGMGILAGVSTSATDSWPTNDIWYSLNVASMYAPGVDDKTHARKALDDSNRVGDAGAFDPVPLQISETGSVRAANVTYENRSLVGEMPHDPGHTRSRAAGNVPRRIEAYGFPVGPNFKLPALCFGKRYFFLPYLIGHGGALPVCLRDPTVAAATKLRPKTNGRIALTSQSLAGDLAGSGMSVDDVVRAVDYRRTTPVAAPRLANERGLPGIPDGVDALAAEIPVKPTAITLAAGESTYFYRNKERTEGVLEFTSPPGERALQIDFGGLWSNASPRGGLRVMITGRSATDPLKNEPLLDVTITAGAGADWPADLRCGLRIVAGSYGLDLFQQQLPDGIVERPPQFAHSRTISTTAIDFSLWNAFSICIENNGTSDTTFIPPVVSTGTNQGDDRQVADPHEVPLPEAAHKRAITVLDGIGSSGALTSVDLLVRRPAVEFATYERWINWDLTDKEIQDALDDAHSLVVGKNPTAADDLTIDDPAVERIVVELVGLFPDLTYYGRALLPKDWSAKAAVIGGINTSVTDAQTLTVSVGQQASTIAGTVQKIVLAKGGVYELRLYGAVPEAKQAFAASLPDTGARFGNGVWQGLPKFSGGGKTYRLGAPLVRTFEVATPEMPELWSYDAQQTEKPLDIRRASPPAVPADRAPVALTQDFVKANYRLLRYISHVSLLSQRWGWRGRPLPMLRPDDLAGVGDAAVRLLDDVMKNHPHAKDFEEAAFIDRRVDDIGVIEATKLHLAHVLPPAAGAADGRPPIFVKDLRYRGGANWWRFALEATSRYAAMKPSRSDLIAYTHIDPTSKFTPHWHTLVVRDRDTGRKPKRPGLLLVLPLTETVMADAAVPPLLAIFSEPMFANFHIGDGVEAALDYVRHPLPDAAVNWSEDESRQVSGLLSDMAKAYGAVMAAVRDEKPDQRDAAALQLRIATATFNRLVRGRQAALAAIAAQKARDRVVQVAREPDSPDQERRLHDAQVESSAAESALAAANADVLTAQQQLDATTAGQIVNLPNLQPLVQRFWPQIGPDPIITVMGHSGRPVPIRVDGPLGYTFDVETEAPNFGRSGYLMTPVAGQDAIPGIPGFGGQETGAIQPWTLLRARFRRLEVIELSNYQRLEPTSDASGSVPLLLSSEGISAPPSSAIPREFHEGLVVEFPEIDAAGAGATISVAKGTSFPAQQWSNRYVRVKASVSVETLTVFLDTDLGPAGTYNVALLPTTRLWLRLVLSQREKPEKSEQPYEPVLDVSVRLLMDDDEVDGLARSQAGAWLTVACLPLLAGGKTFKPSDPVYVNAVPDGDAKHAPQVVGARLTPFTPPLWCQFTQDVSRFDVTTTAPNATSQSCPVGSLAATLDGNNAPQLTLVADDGSLQSIQSVKWLATDPTSQIEGVVAAIVTEFVTDAFDRLRERPVGVYRIVDGARASGANPGGPVTMKPMWSPEAAAPAAKLTRARVRLMSLMRLKMLDPWRPPPETLADYFAESFDDAIAMEAADANGRILGVSKPIEVGGAT
jgi:hypothetical protein